MRYTIEGFSQTEAIKFRRTEIVNGKEKVVTLDCTDLVILRWFVDFWPNMMKVEIGGRQYAWLSYKALIEDMPLIGIKKGMLALRLKKMVDFGILSHQTVKSGGTFSYYGFGPEYVRLIDTNHAQETSDPAQDFSEGVPNKLDTTTQQISDQINPSTKDSSTKDNTYVGTRAKKKRQPFREPTLEEVTAYCQERNSSVDPQAFIAYYQTRGWELKGGAKMKDWKASVRYWERTEKKYSGNGNQTDRRSQYTDEQNAEFDEYAWDPDKVERI